MWKIVRTALDSQEEPRCLSTNSDSTRVESWLSTPQLPIVQAMGWTPLEQPNSQCKGLVARAHVWSITKQTALSSAHCPLWFISVPIQMVSVLGWIMTAVHMGWLSQLDPSVYQEQVWIFSTPTLQATEATTETGAVYLKDLYTLQGPVVPTFLETVGWQTQRDSSAANKPAT